MDRRRRAKEPLRLEGERPQPAESFFSQAKTAWLAGHVRGIAGPQEAGAILGSAIPAGALAGRAELQKPERPPCRCALEHVFENP